MSTHERGTYVLPWERPPSWLYLPHLTGGQPAAARESKKRKLDPTAEWADCELPTGPSVKTVEDEPCANSEETAAKYAEGEVRRIRGQGSLPGAWQRPPVGGRPTEGGDNVITSEGQGDTGEALRGRRREREGDGEINGQQKLPGAASGKRLKAEMLTGLQWAFADHAARVASKAERCKDVPAVTPAERMQALRLRIAARATSSERRPICSTATVEAATVAAQHGNGDGVEQRGDANIGRPNPHAAETNSWTNRQSLLARLRSSTMPPDHAA